MIDTHSHIFKEYYDNIDEIINKMKDNIIIVSGTNDNDNKEVLSLCDKYTNVYGTLGIHPSEIDNITEDSFEFIEKNMINPKIVGIGEIGLDYHYGKENSEIQKQIFIKQIEMARKYDKAVVVHSRDAINDTYNILNTYAKDLRINIHCYSSSLEMAKKFISLNCNLGIGGVVTFKNSNKLSEVVKNIPLEYLLLETDSPYLTPEPLRGNKNEPFNVVYVAKKIAEIKSVSLDEVLEVTTANAKRQFDLNN